MSQPNDSAFQIEAHDYKTELARVRALSRLLDNRFEVPGLPWRFGFDGIVGLLPGVGDAIGAGLSIYIIASAAKVGVSKRTLGKMIFNTMIDTAVGSIPLFGDFFDFIWQSNRKNVLLLEAEMEGSYLQPRSGKELRNLVFGSVVLLGFVCALLFVALIVSVLRVLS